MSTLYSYGEPEAKEGDVVCYGQPVALVTLPEEGGQVRLCVGGINDLYIPSLYCSLPTAWLTQ